MTKLRRTATSARKVAAKAEKQRSLRKAQARTGSVLDHAMALLPISDAGLHRIFLAIILGGAVALAWLVASLAGVPAMAAAQVASVARQAGFEVRRVEVRGTKHLNELKIYERVLAERNRAMPEVDVKALRADLMELSWVQDARVSRQLPDTLVVDIIERKARAVLRVPGGLGADGKPASHFVLIDAGGKVLDPVSAAQAHRRLILSGEGVEGQVAAVGALLDVSPALKAQVAEADWIGNRRWNLIFKTGQVLELPEGDAAPGALVGFARLDGTNRLLGGKATAFDMRAADRIYIRVPGRADGQLGSLALGHAIATSGAGAPASASGSAKPEAE